MSRKDEENRIIRAIDDKVGNIRNEITHESNERNTTIEHLKCLDLDLPKLNESIKDESEERKEMDSNIMKKTSEELLKMSNAI